MLLLFFFFYKPKASSSDESQGQGLGRRQSIWWIVTDSTTKKGTVQKTSVGLHWRGVIPAISVGNTSTLPAGFPSGGVRVGAAANTTETDVQLGERRRMFFTFGSALPSAGECRARRGEGQKMVNGHRRTRKQILYGHKKNKPWTPDCTNMRPINRYSSHPLSPQISFTSLSPPSALCLRSTQCCLYPMLLAVVAGSFTSLLPGSLPWISTSSSVACHSAGSQGFKGKLDKVFMG